MNLRRPVPTAIAAALSGLSLVVPASAQDVVDPNVTIVDRPRPDFDPLGVRAGNFLIFPSLTVSETYDDNIFAVPDDETDDFITEISPRVRTVSNFVRHRLGLTAGADIGLYLDESDENYEDFFASADGRLDILRSTFLDADATIGRFHEGRDDPEDVGGTEPTEFLSYGGGLALNHTINRVFGRLTGRAVVFDYDDVSSAFGTIDQDDRDRIDYDVLLRVGYIPTPRFNVFTEGRYTIEDRDQDVDDQGFERDSDGWEIRGGVGIDLTAVLFGEAFVGYRTESFDEPTFDDVSGISFGADLTWNPTTLTTLVLSGDSDIDATTQSGASSNFESNVALSIDHELLRNLLVGGDFTYGRDDFDGIDRVDNTFGIGASVTYLLNRYLSLEGGYFFEDRSSDLDSEEFTRNRISLGVTAQL